MCCIRTLLWMTIDACTNCMIMLAFAESVKASAKDLLMLLTISSVHDFFRQ